MGVPGRPVQRLQQSHKYQKIFPLNFLLILLVRVETVRHWGGDMVTMGTSDQISDPVAVAAVLPVFDAVKSMSLKPRPREMHLTNLAMTSANVSCYFR